MKKREKFERFDVKEKEMKSAFASDQFFLFIHLQMDVPEGLHTEDRNG
jgi:hypothetical protein